MTIDSNKTPLEPEGNDGNIAPRYAIGRTVSSNATVFVPTEPLKRKNIVTNGDDVTAESQNATVISNSRVERRSIMDSLFSSIRKESDPSRTALIRFDASTMTPSKLEESLHGIFDVMTNRTKEMMSYSSFLKWDSFYASVPKGTVSDNDAPYGYSVKNVDEYEGRILYVFIDDIDDIAGMADSQDKWESIRMLSALARVGYPNGVRLFTSLDSVNDLMHEGFNAWFLTGLILGRNFNRKTVEMLTSGSYAGHDWTKVPDGAVSVRTQDGDFVDVYLNDVPVSSQLWSFLRSPSGLAFGFVGALLVITGIMEAIRKSNRGR